MSSTGFVDATAGAVEHCQSMAQAFPDLKEPYEHMASYVQDKLWHQLTVEILDFLANPANVRQCLDDGTHSFLALYNHVVLGVDSKLNPLALARIASLVSNCLAAHDRTAAKAILENLLAKDKLGVPATVFVESKHGLLLLQPALLEQTTKSGSGNDEDAPPLQEIAAKIQKNAAILQDLGHEHPEGGKSLALVHAAHYEMAMTYYKVVGPPQAFYKQAMLFLNYAPMPVDAASVTTMTTTATTTNYHQLAVDLCLAALTGDGVYDLGQVEQTPVLQLLKGTPQEWLVHLLQACAVGDVSRFQQLSQQHAAAIAQQPALVHRATAVQEKLTLLCLVQLVTEQSSQERRLTFEQIATRLCIALDQVEWVCMRALSVGLMEGSIDQVDQTVDVTGVVPRVLNANQVSDLAAQFASWATKVQQTKEFMQEKTPTFA